MSIHSHLFDNEQDLQKMRAFLIDARKEAGHCAGYWHVGDLAWHYFLLCLRVDPRQHIRLWEDENGALAGYAWFHDDLSTEWQVRPADQWQGLEDEMLTWVETRWLETVNDPATPRERIRDLRTGTRLADTRKAAFLEQHGFVKDPNSFVQFLRPLDASRPIAQSTLLDGFVVRSVNDESEAANRASAHREAFHPSRVTDEAYAHLMRMPEYDRNLDIVAVSPDGVIASYALAWMDAANKIGEFEPVGCRVAFRQRGLTRAVLLEGLRRMQARGAETALVWAKSSNAAAIRLYESVGFQRVNIDQDYVHLQGAQSQ